MRSLLFILVFSPILALGQAPAIDTTPATYKIGDPGITKPTISKTVDPEFTDDARQRLLNGRCLVGLIVDTQGIPQNVHIVRCTDQTFEANSVSAVKQYRFHPATKQDGTAVPVELSIFINFRIDGGSVQSRSKFRVSMRAPQGITTSEPDVNGIYPLSNKVEAPILKNFDDEGFSDAGFYIQGVATCDINLTIDAKGKPSNPELLHCTAKKLEEPALQSLLKSKYKPGKLNGKPIAVRTTIHVEYLGLAQGK